MKKVQSLTYLLFIAIVVGAFAFKVPFAAARLRITPDVVSYNNIARNLATGQGFTSTLKLYYSSDTKVVHPALYDWPPAYPCLAAVVLRFGGNLIILQIINTLLTALAAGIVMLIGVRVFDRRVGLFSGIAAAIAPNLFRAGTMAMADALALTLSLAALFIVLRPKQCGWSLFVAGIFAAASALTRYPYAVVGIASIVWLFSDRSMRRSSLHYAVGFLCLIAPVLAYQWTLLHSPLVQTQALHYATASFHTALWNSKASVDPLYALHQPAIVCAAIARNIALYGVDLLIGMRGLFLLGFGFLVAIFRVPLTRERKLLLIVAVLIFIVHAVTWSIPAVKGSRFMLLAYYLLVPFCAVGMIVLITHREQVIKSLAITACTITVVVYIWGCVTSVVSASEECIQLPSNISRVLIDSLPPEAAIASNSPWVISYSTNAPTALLPHDLNIRDLNACVQKLNIGEIVLLGNPSNQTARSVRSCYATKNLCPGVKMALTQKPSQGQKAYDGTWNIMPQIVQKLPTTHSANIAPKKNGRVRR